MFGKLLTHLRDQRSKQSSLFHFTEEDLQQPSEDSNITAKDLTKYIYGVAKGMEYIVSKNVSFVCVYKTTECPCDLKHLSSLFIRLSIEIWLPGTSCWTTQGVVKSRTLDCQGVWVTMVVKCMNKKPR